MLVQASAELRLGQAERVDDAPHGAPVRVRVGALDVADRDGRQAGVVGEGLLRALLALALGAEDVGESRICGGARHERNHAGFTRRPQ